jgi:hypothetical protein
MAAGRWIVACGNHYNAKYGNHHRAEKLLLALVPRARGPHWTAGRRPDPCGNPGDICRYDCSSAPGQSGLGSCSREPVGYEGSQWNLYEYVEYAGVCCAGAIKDLPSYGWKMCTCKFSHWPTLLYSYVPSTWDCPGCDRSGSIPRTEPKDPNSVFSRPSVYPDSGLGFNPLPLWPFSYALSEGTAV